MKSFFIIFFALSPLALAQSPLDLLELNRHAEQIDPNAQTAAPDKSVQATEESEEQRIITINPDYAGSPLDALWAHAVFYENAQNPYIQSIAFAGMLHSQGAWGSIKSDTQQENLAQTSTRRVRLGARMKAFYKTDIEAIADLDPDSGGQDLNTLKAEINLTGRDRLSVGKFRPHFGYESRSSQNLPVIERSLIGNLLLPERTLGAVYTHDFNLSSASIGYFSGSTANGLPGFDSSGYVYAGAEGLFSLVEGAPLSQRWHLDYIYNADPAGSESITQSRFNGARNFSSQIPIENPMFRHLFSAGVEIEEERWNFVANAMLARNESALWGVTLQPTYWLMPGTLQLVGRIHYAKSSSDRALVRGYGVGTDPTRGIGPYDSGDEFYSIYDGANLHIYQDKLKIMSGLEYSKLIDNTSDTSTESLLFHAAARLAF